MPKKKEDMSPEEYELVKLRMKELREKAVAARQATAADGKQVKVDLVEARNAKLLAKKDLIERHRAEAALIQETLKPKAAVAPIEQPVEIEAPKKKQIVDSSEDDDYYKKIKTKIKNKIKKYQVKYAAPQAQPQVDFIAQSARETLKNQVRNEIQQMAYNSVFPSHW